MAPDIGWLTRSRYAIRGLMEIDVSVPQRMISEHRARTGERLSFMAFLTACVGRAVGDDRRIQAMRDWKGDLVIFDDVDISILVEREKDGVKYPLAHIVRAADKKSFRQIHEEIRQVQARPHSGQETRSLNTLVSMPSFLRRLLLWGVSKNPQVRKQSLGTVTLSAVGMFGRTGGWAMGPNFHPLGLIVGSIVEKPGVVDGRIEIRQYLYLTLEFDHEVVDGAPAARFTQALVDRIESGYGIEEDPAE